MHNKWLNLLAEVENELPERVAKGVFRSMHVTYAKPYVERLFYSRGEHRVFLHRIDGCMPEEALWHSHPWPSLIKVLDTEGGLYRHSVGDRNSIFSSQVGIASVLRPITYTMLEPKAFHSVSTDKSSWSVMITGPRWSRPEPSKHQAVISQTRVQELLARWRLLYPVKVADVPEQRPRMTEAHMRGLLVKGRKIRIEVEKDIAEMRNIPTEMWKTKAK